MGNSTSTDDLSAEKANDKLLKRESSKRSLARSSNLSFSTQSLSTTGEKRPSKRHRWSFRRGFGTTPEEEDKDFVTRSMQDLSPDGLADSLPNLPARNTSMKRLVATPEEDVKPVSGQLNISDEDDLPVYGPGQNRLSVASAVSDDYAESIESGYTGSVTSQRPSIDGSFCSGSVTSEVEHKSVKSGVTLLQMVSTFRGKLKSADNASGEDLGDQIDISGIVPVRRIEVHPPVEPVNVHDHDDNTSADESHHKSNSVDSLENLDKAGEDRPHLVNPQEVVVSGPIFEQAEPVHLNPVENLRRKNEMISKMMNEKTKILAEILNIPHEDFDNIAELSAVIDGEKEPKELILASIIQTERLSDLVSADLKLHEKLPEDDYQDNSAPNTPKADAPKALSVTLPVEPVMKITQTLNDQLTQLLAIMTDRDDEMERLRHQLKEANQQIQALHEISRTPGHSRPNSFISIGSELSEIDESAQSGDEINKALFANSPGISMESTNSDEPGAIIQAVEDEVAEVCEEIADEQAGNAMETIHVTVGSCESSQEQDTLEEMQIETAEETPAIEAVEIPQYTIVQDATVDESQTEIDTNANTQVRTGSVEDISAVL